MPYKIRTKKTVVVPTRIASRTETVIENTIAHPKRFLTGIGVIVVLLLVLFFIQNFGSQGEEKAWSLESEASRLFHEPPPLPEPLEEGEDPPEIMTPEQRLEESARLYREILEKYPSTATAVIAWYEIGNVYYQQEKFDLAEEQYLAFIEKYPDKKELVSIVQLKLGYLFQRKGDVASGLEYFRLLYETEGAKNRDQAGFEIGRLLEQADKREKAKEIYKRLTEDYSQSPWGAEAEARLILLDPPSEPEPEAAAPEVLPEVEDIEPDSEKAQE